MTVQELAARFPEIPEDLHEEPLLAQFAETFGEWLRTAQKPAACSAEQDAGNNAYMKLINPMAIYRLGLFKREWILGQLQEMIEDHRADPAGVVETLAPAGGAPREVRGPGCE